MFGAIWMLANRLRIFLRRFMPTNILLAAIFTRRGLKWGVPAMLGSGLYVFAAAVCAGLGERGGWGWVNLLVLLFVWNALKFIVAGPVSVVFLVRVRIREAQFQRLERDFGKHSRVPLPLVTRAPARVMR